MCSRYQTDVGGETFGGIAERGEWAGAGVVRGGTGRCGAAPVWLGSLRDVRGGVAVRTARTIRPFSALGAIWWYDGEFTGQFRWNTAGAFGATVRVAMWCALAVGCVSFGLGGGRTWSSVLLCSDSLQVNQL